MSKTTIMIGVKGIKKKDLEELPAKSLYVISL
jgi:hypothetical protein